MFTSPELVQGAFGEFSNRSIEQLERGLREGVFHDIDPVTDAEIVQGAVWACTQRQWAAANYVAPTSVGGPSRLPARIGRDARNGRRHRRSGNRL